jgi:predicted MFS family arabinose efflux permease
MAFGASYLPIGALLVLWSANVFHESPATGLSVVLFSMALGCVVGPAVLGVVAGVFDLRVAFWCAAALTVLSIVLGPSSDTRGTTTALASTKGSEPAAETNNDGE